MAAKSIIDLVRSRLGNVKEISKAISAVNHPVLRGRFREILLESLIEPYLPANIEVLTGTIVGANGEERKARNEDDLVIFDHSWAPLLLKTRGRDAIIPVTGVRGQIEVKTRLTGPDLKNSLAAAIEINQIAIGRAPVGLVFAFDTALAKDAHVPTLLMDYLTELKYQPNPGQTTFPIQAVCILGRDAWFLTEPSSQSCGWYHVVAEEDRELLAFVSVLSNSLFADSHGLGTHVLDLAWLVGPDPAVARIAT